MLEPIDVTSMYLYGTKCFEIPAIRHASVLTELIMLVWRGTTVLTNLSILYLVFASKFNTLDDLIIKPMHFAVSNKFILIFLFFYYYLVVVRP